MSLVEDISLQLQAGKAKAVKEMVQQALDEGLKAKDILENGLLSGMNVIGEKFKNNEVFVPEVLVAARAMNMGVSVLKPYLQDGEVSVTGKVAIGTVQGDLHDIGKNLVKLMLEGKGFEVVDLGADVAPLSVFGETDPLWRAFDAPRRRQIWPVGNHVVWKFPGVKASGGKPFTMEWCDGIPEENPLAGMLPSADALAAAQKLRMKSTPSIGKMIRGSKGWMMLSHGSMPVVLLDDGTRVKAPKIARGPGHYHDFLTHCIDGSRGALDFVARGTAMQDALLMGNAAQVVPGTELVWDASKRAFSNSEEATRVLYPKYRDGWTLEGLNA